MSGQQSPNYNGGRAPFIVNKVLIFFSRIDQKMSSKKNSRKQTVRKGKAFRIYGNRKPKDVNRHAQDSSGRTFLFHGISYISF